MAREPGKPGSRLQRTLSSEELRNCLQCLCMDLRPRLLSEFLADERFVGFRKKFNRTLTAERQETEVMGVAEFPVLAAG